MIRKYWLVIYIMFMKSSIYSRPIFKKYDLANLYGCHEIVYLPTEHIPKIMRCPNQNYAQEVFDLLIEYDPKILAG